MTDRDLIEPEQRNNELIFQANSERNHRNLNEGGEDRFQDDGESHDFSDTENEHFSAPGQFVQRTFQE